MGIANKIKSNQDKDGMLRRSLERLIQLYTDKSHFVYELLQNAEDAEAHRISFIQYSDRLEVMHDGKPFTEQNLQGLCDVGKSDKVGNLNQIGEFGVGFKSVFSICENVKLYSSPGTLYSGEGYEPFAVEIVDFTTPHDIEPEVIPDCYTTKFVFPYAVGLSFSGFTTFDELNSRLSKRLTDLGFTTLLFMKNLDLIEYDIRISGKRKRGKYKANKKMISENCMLISSPDDGNNKNDGDQKEELSYLKFSKRTQEDSKQTVDIAFAATLDNEGNFHFKKVDNPYISVYFPTETESKLDFIIQGPFRTTPNRSSVPATDKSNIKFAKLAGGLLLEALMKLRQMNQLSVDLLTILPIRKERFDVYPLFKPLYDRLLEFFENQPYLPTNRKNVYVNASHALMTRSNVMTELFPSELISELYDDGKTYEWLPEEIKEIGPYSAVHTYLNSCLKISSLRPEDLRNKFKGNPTFLKRRSNTWLVKMYKMYNTVPGVFMEHVKVKNMLEIPIVLTKSRKIVAPYQKVNGEYVANVFLPTLDIQTDSIELVDPYIYRECKDFFEHTLRLTAPDEYELFVKTLETRYGSNTISVSFQEHIKDVRLVLKYIDSCALRKDQEELMKSSICLKCHRYGQTVWASPFFDEIWFPVSKDGIQIEEYFKGVEDGLCYVDWDDYKNAGITYKELQECTVIDDLLVNKYLKQGVHKLGRNDFVPYTWNTDDSDFLWKLSLKSIRKVLTYIEDQPDSPNAMLKSQVIFKLLQMNEEHLQGTINIMRDDRIYSKESHTSEIVMILNNEAEKTNEWRWNGKWLYAEDNKLVSQSEISRYELNQSLYGKVNPDSEIYKLLNFYKNEDDIREEAEKEYDQLSELQKESYFEIELQRRFGLTVEDLDSLKEGTQHKKKDFVIPMANYEFPVNNVKNWNALRKHAAETLYYAEPVKYESVRRSIRVSKTDDSRSYLLNMYRVGATNKTACQICHQACSNFNATQIEDKQNLELDQLYLCLCPNCASEFRLLRNDKSRISQFIHKITSLNENEIERNEHVEVTIGTKKVWFTQTHIAEIAELLRLKNQVETSGTIHTKSVSSKPASVKGSALKVIKDIEVKVPETKTLKTQTESTVNNNNSIQVTVPCVYDSDPRTAVIKKTMKPVHDLKGYIGRSVYLIAEHENAIVKNCDAETVTFSCNGRQIIYYVADCRNLDVVYDA